MPFIKFRGFEKKDVLVFAPKIIKEFSGITEVTKDMVKIEISEVEIITSSPYTVEISMFKRDQEKHNAIATAIYKILSEYGYEDSHIFYTILSPSLYYKEGNPLRSNL